MMMFNLEWDEQDIKDIIIAIGSGLITALVLAYVLRRRG